MTMLFTLLILFYSVSTHRYALLCPDKTEAIGIGLHACCGSPPDRTCTLCARITKGYDTNCTTNCNGIVVKGTPYCIDCKCRPLKVKKDDKEVGDSTISRSKCPFGHSKREL